MANPTGTQLKQALPAKIRDEILPAVDELVKVLVGNEGGPFDTASVYPDSEIASTSDHAAGITQAMQDAAIDTSLSQALNDLLSGVPGTDAVTKALDKAIDWIEEQLKTVAKVEGDVQKRLSAWNDLNDPHANNDYASPPYGFIPAIENVINAVADTNVDADDLTKPIEDAAAVLAAAGAAAIFTAYALGALQMLSRARGG